MPKREFEAEENKANSRLALLRLSPLFYFLFFFVALSFIYFRTFKGIQGDAYYYYSYAISILWDKDLDLGNQFDHLLPGSSDQTISGGNYFVDARTGRAFSFFNIGTGLLMLPALSIARTVLEVRGREIPDPFDLYFQRYACYSCILLTCFTLLFFFLILRKFFSLAVALFVPALFLVGTNWLFYSTVFSGWAHAYSLSFCTFGLWSFLQLKEKKNYLYAVLFGLASGMLFSIRNFNLVLVVILLTLGFTPFKKAFSFLTPGKDSGTKRQPVGENFGPRPGKKNFSRLLFGRDSNQRILLTRKELTLVFVCFLFFLLAALPQLLYFYVTHGSPLKSSFMAANSALKPFFSPEAENFRVIYLKNLFLLRATLFNSENGLFYFHPLYLFGLVGFILYRHKTLRFQIMMLALYLSVYVYWFLDAAYFDTWFCRAAGAGFGHRRFLDILPFFILGGSYLAEKMRRKTASLFMLSGLVSFLAAGGLSLMDIFIRRYADFYREKDNFLNFYGFLFERWEIRLLFLLLWVCLFLLLCWAKNKPQVEETAERKIVYQHPALAGVVVVLLLFPVFVFRDDPEWDRQRFRERKGFFLLYSPTPLVKLNGKEWSLPEGMGRYLLRPQATVTLPSSLRCGDIVLLKISAPEDDEKQEPVLEIFLENELTGRQVLQKGKSVYSFPVERELREARKIKFVLTGSGRPSPGLVFHEGKIIYREENKPPFGHVDLPVEDRLIASEKVEFEGWVLDDRGLKRVELRGEFGDEVREWGRESAPEQQGIVLAKAQFFEGRRPDVERIFVLYPDILRAGWRATILRSSLPESHRSRPVLVRVVAWDGDGNRSELGRKVIVWKD